MDKDTVEIKIKLNKNVLRWIERSVFILVIIALCFFVYYSPFCDIKCEKELSEITNKDNVKGGLADAVKGADIFIGVSAPGLLKAKMVKTMKSDPIIFAMANPTPEIMPDIALEAGAKIVGTGRSDFPNQVNNVLAFPGLFRGALDAKSKKITEEMKMAAAEAIAAVIDESELNEEYIIPSAFDERVAKVVAETVAKVAKEMNICR